MIRYISHIIKTELPNKGLRKVSFLTKSIIDSDEYFLGTDNNPYKNEALLNLDFNLIKLNNLIEIDNTETLYVDSIGDYYLANYLDSTKNKKQIKNK